MTGSPPLTLYVYIYPHEKVGLTFEVSYFKPLNLYVFTILIMLLPIGVPEKYLPVVFVHLHRDEAHHHQKTKKQTNNLKKKNKKPKNHSFNNQKKKTYLQYVGYGRWMVCVWMMPYLQLEQAQLIIIFIRCHCCTYCQRATL